MPSKSSTKWHLLVDYGDQSVTHIKSQPCNHTQSYTIIHNHITYTTWSSTTWRFCSKINMAWCQQGLAGCCKYPRGKLGNCCDLRHPKLRSRYRPNTWSELSWREAVGWLRFPPPKKTQIFVSQLFRTNNTKMGSSACLLSDPPIWCTWVETSCCAHVLLEKAPKPGLKLPAGQTRHTSKTSVVHLQTSRSGKMQGSMNKNYLLKSPSTRSV